VRKADNLITPSCAVVMKSGNLDPRLRMCGVFDRRLSYAFVTDTIKPIQLIKRRYIKQIGLTLPQIPDTSMQFKLRA
jgi:hypothetical protein